MADPDPLSLIDATADQVSARVVALGEAATGLRNRAPTGVLRGIWETIALVVRRIYDAHVTPMYAQTDRARATGPWLRLHAAYLGVTPKGAQATMGRVTALSATTTATIAAGTELTGASTRLVVTAETEAPAGGAVTVPVRAAVPGAAGNIAPGTALAAAAYPGVTFSLPADWITETGAEGESDEALRRRIDDRWASLGDGYPPAQYRYLAESVPGAKQAIVLRTPRGFGSADVVVIADTDAGVPPPALLDAVRAALDDHRMICRDLRIIGGAIVPIHVEVLFEGGGYTSDQVAAAIEQGMDGAIEGGFVHVADIYAAAVNGLPGLTYFGVAAPLHDVEVGPGSLPDLSVTATPGRLPATHVSGGGTTTGGSSAGPEPITDNLAYGKVSSAGALVPQSPQAPVASGRWALTLPALSAGETWFLGPFPAGVSLAGIESYGVDDQANWTRRDDGVWTYGAADTVPPGVVMDVEVTARRA